MDGYSLIIANTNEQSEQERIKVQSFMDLHVAGILSVPVDEQNYEAIDSTPLVFMSRCREADRYNYVMNDDEKGAWIAADYLINQGFKQFYFLGVQKNISMMERRVKGFTKCLQDYGIPDNKLKVCYGNITHADGYKAMKSILTVEQQPVGVFCSSDQIAIGALAAAREKRLEMKKDISIVGYDNIPMDVFLDYPLTTVNQASTIMGIEGAKMLLQCINSNSEIKTVRNMILQPELIVRET